MKRHVTPAAVVLVAVLGWGCQDPSTLPGPSSPSPQPPPTNSPSPQPPPTSPPTPLATPTHTLTFTASPSCTALPAAALKRTYPVQVQEKPDGSIVVVVVNSYAIMVGWANEAGFTGTRNRNTVHFDITDDMFADYAMIERISGVGDVGYVGTATGTIDNGNIVATFNGLYQRGYGSAPALCQASDHRIEFTPTGS
jgi:hypothetical protein